jgi:phospholipase/lecithinase/hemolysin
VDISEIPAFNAGTTLTTVEHNGCVAYNVAFSNTINQAMASCPGLTIYAPDYFTLLNNVLTNASAYGLINALSPKGFSIDAFDDSRIFKTVAMNGPGANYIFWDKENPTAKLHEIMADVAQQIISPVQIGWLALSNGSNRLDVVNMPVGLNGFIDGTTNLAQPNWTAMQNITSTDTEQSIFVNAPPLPAPTAASGTGGSTDPNNPALGTYNPPFNPGQFYRLEFPFSWSWP